MQNADGCPTHYESPFNMVIAGPSQVGKSTFVRQLLCKGDGPGAIHPRPTRIKYVYGEHQSALQELKTAAPRGTRVELCSGWNASITDDMLPQDNNVLVLDDVANDCRNETELSNLFTRGGHHRNISIILLTQNFFFSGRSAMDVRRNTHYLVLFACRQDRRQVSVFGQRVLPAKWKDFVKAYEDATAERHGHLLVDMTAGCCDRYMLRSRTLSNRPVVYLI